MALDMQLNGCLSCFMDLVFKALADPSRRKLLDQLADLDGQTLSQLCTHLDMSRQAVSKHLVLLERAHLVVSRRVGRTKIHYLNPIPIQQIQRRWIRKFQEPLIDTVFSIKEAAETSEPGNQEEQSI